MSYMPINADNSHDKAGQSKKNQTYLKSALKRTAPPAYLYTFVPDSVEITEPFERCVPRCFGRHAALNVVTQEKVNVKSQLLFDFKFELSAFAC